MKHIYIWIWYRSSFSPLIYFKNIFIDYLVKRGRMSLLSFEHLVFYMIGNGLVQQNE